MKFTAPTALPVFATATNAELVAWYNQHSGQKPLERFRNGRADAEQRCKDLFAACKELAAGKSKAKSKSGSTIAKQKANSAKKKAAAAAPVPPPPAKTPEPEAPKTIELQRVGEKGKRYVSKTAPDSRYHLRDRSSAAKPVDLVRCLCRDNPTATRKEVIEMCIEAGVNKNTAATQYSLWKSAKDTTFPSRDEAGEEGGEE